MISYIYLNPAFILFLQLLGLGQSFNIQHAKDSRLGLFPASTKVFTSSQSNNKMHMRTEIADAESSFSNDSSFLTDRRNFMTGFSVSMFLSSTFPMKSNASTTNPKTGILLPSEGEIETAIPTTWDEYSNPFTGDSSSNDSNTMFNRLDKTSDSLFYKDPRFVEHVDENAVQSMTTYIASDDVLSQNDSVLDLCSSWTSHIDISTKERMQLKRVSGLGMNEEELQKNPVLTDYVVQDLNANPSVKLPYESQSFNVVLCQLSIDYLIHPIEVMKEISRVLKPGGKVVILFSNRLFFSKAVGLWTGADDIDHAYTVGSYLHYSYANFEKIQAKDLSIRKGRGKDRPIQGDPLYAVTAIKGGD